MTEVEMTRLLQDLSQTAKILNKESDSINEWISQIETTLAGFNIGLEVWLENSPLESQSRLEDGPEGPQTKDVGTHELQLGYAPSLDRTPGWNLMLRKADYKRDPEGEGLTLHDAFQVRKLRDASRGHRIAALALMPTLLMALKRAGDEAIQTIATAKRIKLS